MARTNRYLVDTQVFLWFLQDNRKLSAELRILLVDPNNHVFLSVASIWEIILKQAKGKLKIPRHLKQAISASGFSLLTIDLEHVLALPTLLRHHQDPFDRMLICQAQTEHLRLITADSKIWRYKLDIVKA